MIASKTLKLRPTPHYIQNFEDKGSVDRYLAVSYYMAYHTWLIVMPT